MDTGTIAVEVTIATFVLGVVYAAGRLSNRVENLESWRAEVRNDMTEIRGALRRLEALITGEQT